MTRNPLHAAIVREMKCGNWKAVTILMEIRQLIWSIESGLENLKKED